MSGVVLWRVEAHSRGLALVDSVLWDGRDYEAFLGAWSMTPGGGDERR